MSIFIQIHILKGILFRHWKLSRYDGSNARHD